jgi:DNA-binding NarL/FixJ family response regulator
MKVIEDTGLMKVLLSVEGSKGVLGRLYGLVQGIPETNVVATWTSLKEIALSVRRFLPDVLVMDLYLADGTAMDVLRDLEFSKNKPILIVLTEQPYEDIEAQLKVAGADFVLNKSLEFELIVKILGKFSEKEKGNQLAI